jgi:uncharacterized protein YceH (UPF0502 family)
VTDLPVLSPEEQRLLGSLLEKQVTVPASYPLTLNALRTACNQSNNREPVTGYDEQTVERVGRALKDRGLLRIVWSDSGRRTLKYHQTLEELLGLAEDERAVLTVLLLRGPTAPGALKTRTDRLHAFADRQDVEVALRRMAERGLVRELPRRGGERDNRWTHLLGAEPAEAPPVNSAPVATGGERDARVRAAYDAVAGTYAEALSDELTELPFEAWLLDRVAAHADGGPVVEVGCGPGHVTAYLADRGAEATGIDLSPEMVAEARRRFPDGTYEVGDLRRLMRPTTAPGWSAVLAWYSLIHLAPSELPGAVESLARPLVPGGLLVLAMHAGTEVRHVDAWFDHDVDLDFVLHEPADVVRVVEAAGLVEVEWYRRGPYPRRGETTERLYVLARKPA